MGKTLFQGAVTKAEGEVWVRLVPYENYEPTRNIAQASEIKRRICPLNFMTCLVKFDCNYRQAICIALIEGYKDD